MNEYDFDILVAMQLLWHTILIDGKQNESYIIFKSQREYKKKFNTHSEHGTNTQ